MYSTRYGRQRWCWAARRLKCRMAAHLPMWECGAQGAGVGASPHATSVCVRGPWLGGALAWRPHLHQSMCLCTHAACVCGGAKAGSTLRSSQAVPHPSTNRALCRLTSEVERDPVHSTRYGRQHLPAPVVVSVVSVGRKKGNGRAAECGGERKWKRMSSCQLPTSEVTAAYSEVLSRHCR